MADRVRLLAAAALLGATAACAPMYGPPPPGRVVSMPPSEDATFRAGDFAWSQAPGRNTLAGAMSHAGPIRYTCAGATVVLTPETAWSRRRMMVLYRSDQRAALPTEEVRGRQNQAPPGDSNPWLRRATCDGADHFSFTNLPDGAWYAVTIAKPAGGAAGPSFAVMRRVTTRGGRVTPFEF